jgi:hypothetical protein
MTNRFIANRGLATTFKATTLIATAVIALGLLCATAAFGQTATVLNNTPQPTSIGDHPQHAYEHAMSQESNLLGSSAYSFAQGERPLWEFGSVKQEVPLGDVARAYKKGHVIDKKPARVMESQ